MKSLQWTPWSHLALCHFIYSFIHVYLPRCLEGEIGSLKKQHWVTVWPLMSNGRTRTLTAFNQPAQLLSVSPSSAFLWLWMFVIVSCNLSSLARLPRVSVLCLWHLIKCERGSLGMEHQPGGHTRQVDGCTLLCDPVKMHAHTPVTTPYVN